MDEEERAALLKALGRIGVGFTPAGPIVDAADFASAVRRRDPLGAALAGVGAVPGVGDIAKIAIAGAVGRGAVNASRAGRAALKSDEEVLAARRALRQAQDQRFPKRDEIGVELDQQGLREALENERFLMGRMFDDKQMDLGARTQVGNTINTAIEANKAALRATPGGSRVLDFGAGRGLGAREIGAETLEPFAKEYVPTFTRAADIPSGSFDRIISTNTLNVMPRWADDFAMSGHFDRAVEGFMRDGMTRSQAEAFVLALNRDDAVQNIGRILRPGGSAVVTTRGPGEIRNVVSAGGIPNFREPASGLVSTSSYQKGFTSTELSEYLNNILGRGFDVSIPQRVGSAPAAALITKAR